MTIFDVENLTIRAIDTPVEILSPDAVAVVLNFISCGKVSFGNCSIRHLRALSDNIAIMTAREATSLRFASGEVSDNRVARASFDPVEWIDTEPSRNHADVEVPALRAK